jgi:glycosyltransferase involved in cell wall biosynthesis
VAEKGVKQFSRVIKRLKAQGRAPKVLIVGDGPARAEFEADAPDAIFTGFLTGKDLSTAYASADILFYPSITEAFPNVVLEAMASGLPAVCADTIGANTFVKPGGTGFLVDPSSDEGYAKALAELLDNPGLRARMGAKGHEDAARFSWPAVLDEVIENYRETLALRSGDKDASARHA